MAKDVGGARNRGKRRGLTRANKGVADWTSGNAETIRLAIERAAFTGGAIRFGYSRDGGAYALGIYGDGDPYTVYLPPDGDLDEWLKEVIDLYESIADEQAEQRTSKKDAA